MAIYSTDTVSTDIYKIYNFVENIKSKYIDIPEETLILGVYGYLSAMHANLLENTTVMASEYSNEAIPTKAKFERNVISHALSLGINKIHATPATMEVMLGLPEEALLSNMINGEFTLDKEFVFSIGEEGKLTYDYHIDYDIIIRRDRLPNGKFVYSARYDIDERNVLASVTSPYLPTIGEIDLSGDKLITLSTTLRQVKHNTISGKILVNNPLENKILNFSIDEGQLAYFYVDVVEDDVVHYLKPIYDGLYDNNGGEEFINYLYLDESNIRLKFNRDSYQPRQNAEYTIHIYTTNGSDCNFPYNSYLLETLTSERFSYSSNLFIWMKPITDSDYGTDKLSIEELKATIPKEALSRGSVATYTDLNNAFNAIQTDSCRLVFLEKVHNQVERLFYSYLLMKDGDNIIPTNTITATLTRAMFTATTKDNFSISPGSIFYHDRDSGELYGIPHKGITDTELAELDNTGFLYINPFLTVVNKSPFYVSYYITLLNYNRTLYFEYINDRSLLQFVSVGYKACREYFTDPDTFKIDIECTQNINSDFEVLVLDEAGAIQECRLAAYAVFYRTTVDGALIPYRYVKGDLNSYDANAQIYDMQFRFTSNDVISDDGTYITITGGMHSIGYANESSTSFIAPTNRVKFFFLVRLDEDYGREYGENMQSTFDDIVPGLEGYTLTNIYDTGELGLDVFYDYTDITQSYINILKHDDGSFGYSIYKMPVVRYTYLNTEDRIKKLLSIIDRRRRYIENVIFLLEDSFGIDYKFFNTYGQSLTYNIDNENLIDRINLSLRFEIKFQVEADEIIIEQIRNSIKEYIEDINNITDLHMPNLITYITNVYRESLVYIKFIGMNEYESLNQSIYKNPELDNDNFIESQTVPEFINVNTLSNDLPDITFTIVA